MAPTFFEVPMRLKEQRLQRRLGLRLNIASAEVQTPPSTISDAGRRFL